MRQLVRKIAMRYVKRCPRCGTTNDELEALCVACGEFLGLVAAIPEPDAPPEPTAAQTASSAFPRVLPDDQSAESAMVYLEHASGSRWPVQSGQTVGQRWPENGPDVGIEGLPGTRYLHRRHCRLFRENGTWWLEALPQEEFLNPTLVNGSPVAAGTRVQIKNGDLLTLSGLHFTIRILGK